MKLEEAISRLNIMKNLICVDSDEDEENQEGILDIEVIDTVLGYIDNSISKNEIKESIAELNNEEKEIYKKDIGNNELYRLKIIDEIRDSFQKLLGDN